MRDIYNYEQRYSNQLKQINTYYPAKRKAFHNFNNFMITRDLSITRKITLISNLNAFITKNIIKSKSRTTIYETIALINKMDRAPNTIRDYKLAYKSYIHSIGTNKDLIELIKVGNPTVRVPKFILDKPLYPYMETLKEKGLVDYSRKYEKGDREVWYKAPVNPPVNNPLIPISVHHLMGQLTGQKWVNIKKKYKIINPKIIKTIRADTINDFNITAFMQKIDGSKNLTNTV